MRGYVEWIERMEYDGADYEDLTSDMFIEDMREQYDERRDENA